MATLIDTNVILRYLLNDIPEQADEAEKVIQKGAFSLIEIIAEVVYVLVKVYKIPREQIFSIVSPVIDEIEIDKKDILIAALTFFSNSSFDFVDCILKARKQLYKDDIFTFDIKLQKFLQRN